MSMVMGLINTCLSIFLLFPTFYQISKRSQSTVWEIILLIGKNVCLFSHAQVDISVELP